VSAAPLFCQVNLICRDIAASVAFFRRLGLPVECQPGDHHVELVVGPGMSIEWDSFDSVRLWDTAWAGPADRQAAVILNFTMPSRDAVDQTYADLTGAGYTGHQPPYDAFWGPRYAIIEDPDGNSIGLMSPVEDDCKQWPPLTPPKA
jgi:catechol 2,3-dioxygenase-like lactoylglutathione lyase family enzyme